MRELVFCLTILGLTFAGCKLSQPPAAPVEAASDKKVSTLADAVADRVAGAVYGAGEANKAQAPGPATETVEGELGLARKGLPDPSVDARKAADARVLAGLAGDRDKYKALADKFGSEVSSLKTKLDEAEKQQAAERAVANARLEEARRDLITTRFAFVAAGLSGLGAALIALGLYTGLGWKPGAALLGCGLAIGALVFLFGSPFFYVLVTLACLGLAYAAATAWCDARKHRLQKQELELTQATLGKVVQAIDSEKLPEDAPLLNKLRGKMDDAHKKTVKRIRDKTTSTTN